MRALLGRAVVVWLGLFGLAFGNGPLRAFALVRVVRPAVAEAISATFLFVLILLAAWCLVRWAGRRHALRSWLGVGATWAGLTAAVELGMFHFLLGEPWQDVLADYDPRYGYFGFLQLATLLAPAACAALRQAFCMSR